MWAHRFVSIFSLFLYVAVCESSYSRVVNTAQGPVRGYRYENEDNTFVFYGIPYAKAPTGQDRFKAPLLPPVWSETFEAINNSIACPQADILYTISAEHINLQEDCLVVNVYMPVTTKGKLPVVVVFHGGAFHLGSGAIEKNAFIVKSKQAVVVTFNFRMGAHGFLCLGTKFAPGNAGMKDQVALLRWVNKNIASFGGDPDDVILSGYNTGSSSIDLITMSKMARGLFKRVILESGSSIAPFSVQFDPIRNARKYAEMLEFDGDNFDELENFYRNISYEKLTSKLPLARPDSTFLMTPCVERDIGEEIFLEDHPINKMRNGDFEKVPTLDGFLEIEGKFRLPLLDHWKLFMNVYFTEFLPADLQFEDDTEKRKVARAIKKFYFEDKDIDKETSAEFVDYFTDVMFAYPILRATSLKAEAGNKQIYLYKISKSLAINPSQIYANLTTSSDQCSKYLDNFDDYWKNNNNEILDAREIENAQRVSEQISLNFITKRVPVPFESQLTPWPPVKANLSPHMYISRSLKLKGSILKKKVRFWNEIYNNHYRYPIPPNPPQDDQ